MIKNTILTGVLYLPVSSSLRVISPAPCTPPDRAPPTPTSRSVTLSPGWRPRRKWCHWRGHRVLQEAGWKRALRRSDESHVTITFHHRIILSVTPRTQLLHTLYININNQHAFPSVAYHWLLLSLLPWQQPVNSECSSVSSHIHYSDREHTNTHTHSPKQPYSASWVTLYSVATETEVAAMSQWLGRDKQPEKNTHVCERER